MISLQLIITNIGFMGLKKDQEREYARILYVSERLTFKEIAERVGVSDKTVGKWADLHKWDNMRKSMLTTRQNQLVHWYNQLEAINNDIAAREPAIPNAKEADIMSKITANIQRLEVETSIGEYVEVGRKVLTFIQDINLNDAKLFKSYIDEFINMKLKQK